MRHAASQMRRTTDLSSLPTVRRDKKANCLVPFSQRTVVSTLDSVPRKTIYQVYLVLTHLKLNFQRVQLLKVSRITRSVHACSPIKVTLVCFAKSKQAACSHQVISILWLSNFRNRPLLIRCAKNEGVGCECTEARSAPFMFESMMGESTVPLQQPFFPSGRWLQPICKKCSACRFGLPLLP